MLLAALTCFGFVVAVDSLPYRGDRGELQVAPPREEAASVRIDGRLDEPEWRRAAVLTGFTQYEPAEARAATQQTEVRVFYSSEAIYFAIHAFDTEPGRVRASLSERDASVFADDWVRVMLDTNNDNRQAYVFYLNPFGIQTDGFWIEGGERRGSGVPIDFNPDFIWDSYGQRTSDGWVVEMRIPYVSLRFPERPSQTWGINVAREIKRSGFKESWAPLTQNQANTLLQSGRLVGLTGLRPRRLIETTPVATSRRTSRVNAGGELEPGQVEPELGFDARYGITQNLVLDATVNPDFAQIEADANQLEVNERFTLFFAEKRPFFLEGSEVFNTPQRLVYTRAIVDPSVGAKVTGKLGPATLGYLGALDESPRTVTGEQAAFNLLRVRRDLPGGSSAGLLFTDRTLTDRERFNRVVGADGRWVFRTRYTLTGQIAGSWTRSADSLAARPGSAVHLELERSGRALNWELRLVDVGPEFRAASGFLRRPGDAELFGTARYTFYGKPGALVERWGPEVRVNNFWAHSELWRGGDPEEGEVELQLNLFLRGKNSLRAILRDGFFRFDPEDYANYRGTSAAGQPTPFRLPTEPLRHMLAFGVSPTLNPRPWLQVGGRIVVREVPIYAEASRGLEMQFSPDVKIWPTPSLQVDLAHTRSNLWRRGNDSLFGTADLARLRVKYQFNRAISTRALAQYNLRDQDAIRDAETGLPLHLRGRSAVRTDRGDFGVDLLAAYEPTPGRVLFVGWARQMSGPSTYQLAELVPQVDGFFVKASYRFRL